TVRLQNLAYGHKTAGVLLAAVELDLFTKISEGATSIEKIAEALNISLLNTHRLVAACTGIGLLKKDGSEYSNALDVDRFLVKGKRNFAGPWLLSQKSGFEQWKDLADYLRSKGPTSVLGGYESFTYEKAKALHQATYSVGLGAGMRFARDVDMSNRSLILDIGGGSGAYCIAALQAYPHLKAIVFDLEPVCRVADEFIAQWELSDKITTHPGDFTKDPFPPGADIMIQASNLPQYSAKRLIEVFKKGYEVMKPGGEYHLVGEALDEEKGGPLGPSLWGIAEVFAGSEGRSHSEKEVQGYLEEAGFVDVRIHEFISGSLSRITGRKPK
ncbi:MAG: methyltransferase domain-containing protein, partial [Deltaproteobacteria bacterium]|nr:methyltransferase domain-containing protein [Deltaproteobacteria bacterium]